MLYNKKYEFFAEILGTFILILLGCGSVAMVVLFPSSGVSYPGEVIKGGYTNVVFGWGLAVSFGIIASIKISGAHLNPAVSIALAVTGNFPWSKVPYYIIAQLIGAMLGAFLVFIVFYAQWIVIDPALMNTQGILATFPAAKGYWPGFFDQVVGTFVLMFFILALGTYFKDAANNIAFPFMIGALVLAIGISLGGMNGYAINPARDLGPRIVLFLTGFSNTGFAEFRVWSVPILGPIVGAILGAIFYNMFFNKKNA